MCVCVCGSECLCVCVCVCDTEKLNIVASLFEYTSRKHLSNWKMTGEFPQPVS